MVGAAYAWQVVADVAGNDADGTQSYRMEAGFAEITKNYFLIMSLIAPVSSQSFHPIKRTSHGA